MALCVFDAQPTATILINYRTMAENVIHTQRLEHRVSFICSMFPTRSVVIFTTIKIEGVVQLKWNQNEKESNQRKECSCTVVLIREVCNCTLLDKTTRSLEIYKAHVAHKHAKPTYFDIAKLPFKMACALNGFQISNNLFSWASFAALASLFKSCSKVKMNADCGSHMDFPILDTDAVSSEFFHLMVNTICWNCVCMDKFKNCNERFF